MTITAASLVYIVWLSENREIDFTMKNYFNDETDYNMGQFDESFNVVLGIKKAESEFDWFNNPYISLNVYQA